MDFTELFKRVDQKLASQPNEKLLLQCFDAQIGDLALTCVKNAGIKDEILNALGKATDTASTAFQKNPSLVPAATGLAGAGLGAAIGSQTGSQGEFETDDDFKSRKRNSMLTGAAAGGVAGLAAPAAVSSVAKMVGAGPDPVPSVWDKIKSFSINPTSAVAGAGALGGAGLAHLDKNIAMKNYAAAGTAAQGAGVGLTAAADNYDKAMNQGEGEDRLKELKDLLAKATKNNSMAADVQAATRYRPGIKSLGGVSKHLVGGLGGAALTTLLYQAFANRPAFQNS